MLDKLKDALDEIRTARNGELDKFKVICQGNRDMLSERRAILTLELPYKTDVKHLIQARAAAYMESQIDNEAFFGIEGEYVSAMGEDSIVTRRARKETKPVKLATLLVKEWINSADPATAQGRQTVWNVLRQSNEIRSHFISNKNPKGAVELVPVEDLIYILSRQRIDRVIENISGVERAAKSTYRSHAHNLVSFLSKGVPVTVVLTGRRSRLSIGGVATLFEYLETRALKTRTIRAFHDIVLLRALFYAPIAGKEFFDLRLQDERQMLCLGRDSYPIPQSFVTLCKCLPTSDKLMERGFDDKQLNKKLRRLGGYAGLPEVVTPSTFRLFARSVWTNLLIDGCTKAHLPRR